MTGYQMQVDELEKTNEKGFLFIHPGKRSGRSIPSHLHLQHIRRTLYDTRIPSSARNNTRVSEKKKRSVIRRLHSTKNKESQLTDWFIEISQLRSFLF